MSSRFSISQTGLVVIWNLIFKLDLMRWVHSRTNLGLVKAPWTSWEYRFQILRSWIFIMLYFSNHFPWLLSLNPVSKGAQRWFNSLRANHVLKLANLKICPDPWTGLRVFSRLSFFERMSPSFKFAWRHTNNIRINSRVPWNRSS